MTFRSAPGSDLPTGMAGDLAGLLARFGVAPAAVQRDAAEVAAELLAARNLDAVVVGVRHGVLTVQASPAAAALLRYDTDVLIEQLRERGGEVGTVRIRVRR